jgi:hypothetical protein
MVLADRGRVCAISYPPLGFQDMGNLVIDVEVNSVQRLELGSTGNASISGIQSAAGYPAPVRNA